MVFCHSNTTFLAKNVIKTLLGMWSKLCCIRRTNQNGKLVDICFVWTTFICWIPEVFASISHMFVLPWDACASIKLWHSPTEVFLKHQTQQYPSSGVMLKRWIIWKDSCFIAIFLFGTQLSTWQFTGFVYSDFLGTWPPVCCDGIALRGMGNQHGWDC